MPVKFLHDVESSGEVQGTSLDINGNADISGNITSAGWTGDVIASAYLDSDTMHLSVSQDITGHKEFQDNIQARFGNDQDLRIQHTGTHGYLDCETGNLYIRAETDDSHIYIQADNGSGANATYIDVDGDNELILLSKPLKIGTGATVSTILDEDAMGSDSATALATQQSIKAYVTASVSAAGGGDVTLAGAQTFTGVKTFNAGYILDGNTITGIDNASEFTDNDNHIMTSTAIKNKIADNDNSFLTSVPNHSGALITSGTVAAARVATLNQNTTGTAASAALLTDGGDITTHPGTNNLIHTGQISAGTSGLFATVDNSNSIITVNRHSGNYNSQLGFSSNGNIYYRKFSASNDNAQAWNQVYHSGNIIPSADLDADTAHLTTTQTFTGAKTFTGTVALTGTGRITGIDTVSASTDAASKAYVDGAVIANTDTQDLSQSGNTVSLVNGGSVDISTTTAVAANTAKTSNIVQTTVSGSSGSCTGNAATATKISSITNSNIVQLAASQTLTNKTIAASQVTEISNITAAEGAQIENIGSTTISATQWGYLGAATGAITNTDTNTQLSNAEVRAAVAAATDSQVFTDADHTKLNGIATNATADQTNVSGSSGSCTGNAATATALTSGNKTINGTLTVTGSLTGEQNITTTNIIVEDDGQIGSASEPGAMEIADDGVVSFNGGVSVSGSVKSTIKTRVGAISSGNDADYKMGDVAFFGSTTSMDAGKIYYYNSSGNWALIDADEVSTSTGMIGVALGAASNTNGVLLRGFVTLDHDPGSVGQPLFLSTTAGTATATAPSGSGDIVRVIGYCLHATNGAIYFNPDGAFVEVT